MSASRVLALSMVIAAGLALCATPASAHTDLGCRPNHTSNAYFKLSVKRALLSCDVIEFGMTGTEALDPDGAEFAVWGPDNFQGLVRTSPGEYTVAWKGDHAAGAKWCASFVGDYAELCLTT
ncbi:hypothetical protein [Kutzneria chonburiensis]|uniref:Uncharacterized protein n=1 Tax=Kutzneria chonburiensis TaxID=1483604 RepID=A0ABV6MY04_9PSEU|nr:hypothetical protein [Kutzneria chonburiensis]